MNCKRDLPLGSLDVDKEEHNTYLASKRMPYAEHYAVRPDEQAADVRAREFKLIEREEAEEHAGASIPVIQRAMMHKLTCTLLA